MALTLLDEAAMIAAEAGPTVAAYVAQTRAFVEVKAGRLTESLVRFDAARTAYEQAGLPLGAHYLEYSEAVAGLGLLPEALDAARRGLAVLPSEDAPLMTAEAQLAAARLSLLMGDAVGARASAEIGASLMRRQRRPGWMARAVVVQLNIEAHVGTLSARSLAILRRCAGELERAGMRSDAVEAHLLAGQAAHHKSERRAASQSLRAAERLSRGAPVLVRLRGRLAKALLAELAGDNRAVLQACRSGLADLDTHRRALPTMELRALASVHGAELGTLGLRALRATATPARIFTWLERTRAAALARLDTPTDGGVELELSELRAAHAELAGAAAKGEAERPELIARVAAAEIAVRRASWSAPTPSRTTEPAGPPTAARVREKLKPTRATLVEYGILDGQLLATVLDGRRTKLVELGSAENIGPRVDALLFALRRLARPGTSGIAAAGARRSALAALATLRQQLVDPLKVDPQAPLVVVPVGDLQRLPWAPLHAGPTTVVPSAALWLRTVGSGPRGGGVVLVAGPDLLAAPRELADLRTVHPAAITLLPPDSTCQATVEALRTADLAHFACHGRLRADNPAFSALLLTDGPLTVHELSRRAGAPRRVVLAACESGAQVAFAGDEALGFVGALLAGGSDAVLASGVLVGDEQTLPLMHALHERLVAGASMAGALWGARQGLDPDDPAQLASWCAFDAYGGG